MIFNKRFFILLFLINATHAGNPLEETDSVAQAQVAL